MLEMQKIKSHLVPIVYLFTKANIYLIEVNYTDYPQPALRAGKLTPSHRLTRPGRTEAIKNTKGYQRAFEGMKGILLKGSQREIHPASVLFKTLVRN